MKNVSVKLCSIAALTLGLTQTAAAYVGPGAGLSLVGAVWGLLVAVIAAVGFIILWPLRRMLKRKSAGQQTANEPETASAEPGTQRSASEQSSRSD